MKKHNKMTLMTLFVSMLMLIAANTVYAGVNPSVEGSHWRGPTVLADIILTDGGEIDGIQHIQATYIVVSSTGQKLDVSDPDVQDFPNPDFYPGTMDGLFLEGKNALIHYKSTIINFWPDKLFGMGELRVSTVISYDDSLYDYGIGGIIKAKVILLYSIAK